MNFTPEEQAEGIRSFLPDFKITYRVDPVKQAIAESWPDSLDDSTARSEWGWSPEFDLETMTKDMLHTLSCKEKENGRHDEREFIKRTHSVETTGIIQRRKGTYNAPERICQN